MIGEKSEKTHTHIYLHIDVRAQTHTLTHFWKKTNLRNQKYIKVSILHVNL